jgi:hypothetical protein
VYRPLNHSLSLIAHPKDRISTLPDVQTLPFFSSLPFQSLRQIEAPFVPVLDGDTDVGYFDSFESPEDMAKYAEVFKKQRDVEAVEERGKGNRNNWVSRAQWGTSDHSADMVIRLDSLLERTPM